MPGWPNLSELLVSPTRGTAVGLLGAPLAAGSVTPGACDLAPELLRRTLKRIGRYDVETGRELETEIADRGDVDLAGLSIEDATPRIREAVAASAEAHALTLLVGGNNAVTRPAVLGGRPGGMAVHDFFHAVRRLASDPRVRIIDLTEWDPPLDSSDLSALAAARWVAECLAGYEMR